MKPLTAALLLLLLTACRTDPIRPEPPTLSCPDICKVPCVAENGDTGVRWEADPADPDAFDDLAGNVIDALTQKLRRCEVSRATCHKCLNNLRDQGIIQ